MADPSPSNGPPLGAKPEPSSASSPPSPSHELRQPRQPPYSYHQHLSQSPSPSGQGGYYYCYVRSYHPAYAGYPRRPQSALVRGSGHPIASAEDAAIRPDLNTGSRRPSATYSLPPPQDKTGSAASLPHRPTRSENASIAPEPGAGLSGSHQHLDQIEKVSPQDLGIEQVKSTSLSRQSHSPDHVVSTYSLSDVDDDGEEQGLTLRQTVRSLIHLALTAPPLSVCILLYTLVALLYAVVLSPLRLCVKTFPPFSLRLSKLLLSPLNVQRRCIFLPPLFASPSRASSSSRTPLSSDEAVQARSSSDDVPPMSAGTLFTTHILAPFIAFPLAIGAWIMGAAWALGAVVSDERAGDERDERRLVQRLIGYWASWLNWGAAKGYDDRAASRSHEERGRGRRRQEMSMKQDRTDGVLV